MANILSNLFGPVAPGVSPTINPISMLGAGMYSGNPAAALAQMGQMQQAGQQLALNQAMQQERLAMLREEQAREQQKQEALSKAAFASMNPFLANMAPDVANQWRKTLEPLAAAGGAPSTVLGITTAGLAPAEPTSLQRNIDWAMSLPEGDPRREAAIQAVTKPQTQVNVGGGSEFGPVPTAMARVPDTESPTKTRLVTEPGAPALEKRETAQQKLIAPLDALEDSLERYRRVLQEVGPEIMTGPGKLRLQTAYKDLLIKQKEADELGALTGPDLDLVQSGLIDPTGFTAQWYEKTGQAKALETQLDEAKRGIRDARARARGEEPERPQGTAQNPIQLSGTEAEIQAQFEKLPSGSYFIGPDGTPRQKP